MGTKKPTIKRRQLDPMELYHIIDIAYAVTNHTPGVNLLPDYTTEEPVTFKKRQIEVGRALNLMKDIRTYWDDATYSDFGLGCIYLVAAIDCERYNLDINRLKADLGIVDIINKMRGLAARDAEKTESKDSN